MATLPANVHFEWRDLTESPEPVVERSPMERGIPKQRRVTSDARVEMQVTFHFDSKTIAADFESWFYADLHGGVDFFDLVHPRTGANIQARFVGGELGALSYLNPTLTKSKRTARLEYWRSAW